MFSRSKYPRSNEFVKLSDEIPEDTIDSWEKLPKYSLKILTLFYGSWAECSLGSALLKKSLKGSRKKPQREDNLQEVLLDKNGTCDMQESQTDHRANIQLSMRVFGCKNVWLNSKPDPRKKFNIPEILRHISKDSLMAKIICILLEPKVDAEILDSLNALLNTLLNALTKYLMAKHNKHLSRVKERRRIIQKLHEMVVILQPIIEKMKTERETLERQTREREALERQTRENLGSVLEILYNYCQDYLTIQSERDSLLSTSRWYEEICEILKQLDDAIIQLGQGVKELMEVAPHAVVANRADIGYLPLCVIRNKGNKTFGDMYPQVFVNMNKVNDTGKNIPPGDPPNQQEEQGNFAELRAQLITTKKTCDDIQNNCNNWCENGEIWFALNELYRQIEKLRIIEKEKKLCISKFEEANDMLQKKERSLSEPLNACEEIIKGLDQLSKQWLGIPTDKKIVYDKIFFENLLSKVESLKSSSDGNSNVVNSFETLVSLLKFKDVAPENITNFSCLVEDEKEFNEQCEFLKNYFQEKPQTLQISVDYNNKKCSIQDALISISHEFIDFIGRLQEYVKGVLVQTFKEKAVLERMFIAHLEEDEHLKKIWGQLSIVKSFNDLNISNPTTYAEAFFVMQMRVENSDFTGSVAVEVLIMCRVVYHTQIYLDGKQESVLFFDENLRVIEVMEVWAKPGNKTIWIKVQIYRADMLEEAKKRNVLANLMLMTKFLGPYFLYGLNGLGEKEITVDVICAVFGSSKMKELINGGRKNFGEDIGYMMGTLLRCRVAELDAKVAQEKVEGGIKPLYYGVGDVPK